MNDDIWLYIGIFLLGAIMALIDHAASVVDCKLNTKIFKWFQVRHIPTFIAVVTALSAFIYYGLNPDGIVATYAILWIAFGCLAFVIICDIFIIFFKKKK